MVHDHGFKTVVTLRDSYVAGEPSPDLEEETWCRAQEIQYLRLTPMAWEPIHQGDEPPVAANIRKYLGVLNKPESYPILVHCFAGIHRTGAYTALYRMEKRVGLWIGLSMKCDCWATIALMKKKTSSASSRRISLDRFH